MTDFSKMTQRDLVLASLRSGAGKESCAGAKHGLGTSGAAKKPR